MMRALCFALCVSASVASLWAGESVAEPRRYDFDGAQGAALDAYRQGWVAILEHGRWAEAERLYRLALRLDPGFVVAKSVLARITKDSAERDALYREVQSALPDLAPDSLLLLHTYQATLELFAAREAGVARDLSARETMARRAVRDYGTFLAKYPGEWSVMIEYVEWVHALDGPGVALREVERIRSAAGVTLSFSYFPAYFYAELGDIGEARVLAAAFKQRQAAQDFPQPHYIDAFIDFKAGALPAASSSIEAALRRDPRHLLAERLQSLIRSAGGEQASGENGSR